jgi:hypothetical protein
MKVRYQIIVEVTADGMMGPLKVQDLISNSIRLDRNLKEKNLEIGKIRVAAVYTLAPDEKDEHPFHTEASGVTRTPGTDQSRAVEEVRDPRIT